jgi:hypothetical protein
VRHRDELEQRGRHQRSSTFEGHDRSSRRIRLSAAFARGNDRRNHAEPTGAVSLSRRLIGKDDTATIPALRNPGSNAAAQAKPNLSDGERNLRMIGALSRPEGAPFRSESEAKDRTRSEATTTHQAPRAAFLRTLTMARN